MSLSVGDQFPETKFPYIPFSEENKSIVACGFPIPYSTASDKIAGKTIVIVSVPGAFTPTCTANHIPPFIQNQEELKKKGVDEVLVLSANDPFVLSAWGKALGNETNFIKFVSDGNAAFSKSVGLSLDLSSKGFGLRSGRYAIIVKDSKVVYAKQEPGAEVTVSGYEAVLAEL